MVPEEDPWYAFHKRILEDLRDFRRRISKKDLLWGTEKLPKEYHRIADVLINPEYPRGVFQKISEEHPRKGFRTSIPDDPRERYQKILKEDLSRSQRKYPEDSQRKIQEEPKKKQRRISWWSQKKIAKYSGGDLQRILKNSGEFRRMTSEDPEDHQRESRMIISWDPEKDFRGFWKSIPEDNSREW